MRKRERGKRGREVEGGREGKHDIESSPSESMAQWHPAEGTQDRHQFPMVQTYSIHLCALNTRLLFYFDSLLYCPFSRSHLTHPMSIPPFIFSIYEIKKNKGPGSGCLVLCASPTVHHSPMPIDIGFIAVIAYLRLLALVLSFQQP